MSTPALASWLSAQIDEAARIPEAVRALLPTLLGVADALRTCLDGGGQTFFFGNGGSAADAQHWAAELSGRFYLDRPSLAAQALTANTSALTAIGNDYGFEEIFARPLVGAGRPGDVAVGISTSGTSGNVLRAFEVARLGGLVTIGFCGARTEAFEALCDYVIAIPSPDTPRVQEGHELAAHLVFAAVESMLFGDG